ncbi:3-carboxymuconate cyclase [Seminavis robusta]|uniref:3-carboxymuconate cyclase n=1 Tax=Seminavis robusta TaxID=568900 RepID=A0A9N8HSH8_9STRA|nr:3-carboxymuconate cyclase [Seminavis robusta]|eukprot:Sro1525_g279680.1 3-carboxymuconate cyclase (447) ;mRNA; r:9173-10513
MFAKAIKLVLTTLACTMLPSTAGAEMGEANLSLGRDLQELGQTFDSLLTTGALYTLSNAATNNELLIFYTKTDGSLEYKGSKPTGGLGSGPGELYQADPLASQNVIAVTRNTGPSNTFLFTVNAQSNTVSSFRVNADYGLEFVAVVGSGGQFPSSIAIRNDNKVLYVMNAAFDGSVVGFEVMPDGNLRQIPNSFRSLNAGGSQVPPDQNLSPSQVEFTPDGKQLVVTIKDGFEGLVPGVVPTGNGRVLVWNLNRDGVAESSIPVVTETANRVPFGFALTKLPTTNDLILLLTESVAPNEAVSSYKVNADGTLTVISQSVPTFQETICWMVQYNSRYAYGANFFGDSITSYSIDGTDGSMTLLESAAAVSEAADSFPLEMLISGNFLYQLFPGSGTIGAYAIQDADGSLQKVGEYGGLEPTLKVEQGTIPAFSDLGGAAVGLAAVKF